MNFTNFEQSVIDAICVANRQRLPGLLQFVSSAQVLDRENTGHGFYTYFRSPPVQPNHAWPRPIDGPTAKMIGLGEDVPMGFLLWCSVDEQPSALEGFQYGGGVDLKAFDLTALSFSELLWDKVRL